MDKLYLKSWLLLTEGYKLMENTGRSGLIEITDERVSFLREWNSIEVFIYRFLVYESFSAWHVW